MKQQAQARSFAVWLSIFLTFVCTVWSHLGHWTVVGYLVKYIPSVVAPRKNPSVRYKKTRLSFSLQDNRTLHFKTKNCQRNPPWSLNVFYILVILTDNAQVIFVLIEVCQPGGAAINFSKIAWNQNQTTLLLLKTFCYP